MGRRQEPCGPAHTTAPAPARTAKAGFAEVVLVCAKCAKRQGVDRKRLGRALKRAAGGLDSRAASTSFRKPVPTFRVDAPDGEARPKSRKVKVVETGCLGPCPKRLLTVATAASLARGRVVLLDPSLEAVSSASLALDVPLSARPDADG